MFTPLSVAVHFAEENISLFIMEYFSDLWYGVFIFYLLHEFQMILDSEF